MDSLAEKKELVQAMARDIYNTAISHNESVDDCLMKVALRAANAQMAFRVLAEHIENSKVRDAQEALDEARFFIKRGVEVLKQGVV